MEKSEKDMFLKLQAVSKTQGNVCHACKAPPGKLKRVTCDYHFDGTRSVCKYGFLFLYDLGGKHLKNLQKHLAQNLGYMDLIGCPTTYPP